MPSDYVDVKSITLTPDPVHAPGSAAINVQGTLKKMVAAPIEVDDDYGDDDDDDDDGDDDDGDADEDEDDDDGDDDDDGVGVGTWWPSGSACLTYRLIIFVGPVTVTFLTVFACFRLMFLCRSKLALCG
jgi:hypothetical protein